jgi:hypothetical protein
MSANAAYQLKRVHTLMSNDKSDVLLQQNVLFADELQRLVKVHLKYVLF